jgi:hypothetical protein
MVHPRLYIGTSPTPGPCPGAVASRLTLLFIISSNARRRVAVLTMTCVNHTNVNSRYLVLVPGTVPGMIHVPGCKEQGLGVSVLRHSSSDPMIQSYSMTGYGNSALF